MENEKVMEHVTGLFITKVPEGPNDEGIATITFDTALEMTVAVRGDLDRNLEILLTETQVAELKRLFGN